MLRKLILLSFFLLLGTLSARANHILGGEITWRCTDEFRFVVRLTLYLDCNGNQDLPFLSVDARTSPTKSNRIHLYKILEEDISPSCNPYQGSTRLNCSAGAGSGNGLGAVQRVVYESEAVLLYDTNNSYGGILFTWDACCRGQADNLMWANSGITLRAMMYTRPKPHPIFNQLRYICEHESPSFDEVPQLVATTGMPLSMSNTDSDPKQDSLYYRWANLLEQPSAGPYPYPNLLSVFWDSTYSYQQPFPGLSQHPLNSPASINHQTGEIALTSYTQGSYVYGVKVEAWKCGELKSEVYRDAVLMLMNDPFSNQAPELRLIPNSTGVPIVQNGQNLLAQVKPGERIAFDIQAVDSNVQPITGLPQELTFSAFGAHMAQPWDDDSACVNPPCATVLPANGQPSYTGDSINTVSFVWEPNCNHVGDFPSSGCYSPVRRFFFLLKMQDDQCPVPASSQFLLEVEIRASRAEPARLLNGSFNGNGGADLHWLAPQDTGWRFSGYAIHYKPNQPASSFQAIDTIFDYQTQSWYGSNLPNSGGGQYYITVLNPCHQSRSSDTLHLSQISLSEVTQKLPIAVWPNPSSGQLTLMWDELIPSEGHLEILDVTGKRLERRTISSGSNRLFFHLPDGVYLFRLSHEGRMWQERVVFGRGLNR